MARTCHQVCQTTRPNTPSTLASLRMILGWKSNSIGPGGTPTRLTRPSRFSTWKQSLVASALPLSSMDTSTPRPPVASMMVLTGSCSLGLIMVASGKSWRAMAMRFGATSRPKTLVAPNTLEAPMANMPMGPQPNTATLFAFISPAMTPCIPTPSGSWMAPSS